MSKNVKKQRDGEVFVAISDMGKGLSSTIIPKLFGKFMTDSDYGTGLGLYITKKLVEAHGGKIWAYNNKDGKGATFVFSLSITGDHDSNGINS
jgi:nitrogen fixation/metabolism regulation signal transduction histidine kinase